ncbi:MAG: hypothetical protein V4507_11400 [Verrucomicrobiota bacterium]
MKTTIPEVIDILERFVSNKLGNWEWDDFISIRQKDEFVDALRLWAGDLHDDYPAKKGEGYCNPEGIEQIRKVIEGLKKIMEAHAQVIQIMNQNKETD